MTSNNNNQTETNTPTFEKGQEVWVKAIIEDPEIDWDGDIKFMRYHQGGRVFGYAPPREIRTTEQIWKDVIKNDRKSDKFRVYIDDVCQGLNNYSIYAPDGTEYVYPKDSFTPGEVLQICNGENAKITVQNAEKNADPTTISNTETVTEPDRNRRFKKRDKVQRRKIMQGRTMAKFHEYLPFDEILDVKGDEDDNGYIHVESGGILRYLPFFLFDLVEPAPEPKYWVVESTLCYYINYKGADDCIYTAVYMNKEVYTLEEAQAECDKLNQKESHE